MDINNCANCEMRMLGWKTVEEKSSSTLLTCQKCKLIQYCDKNCQEEHWLRVHKDHCEFFADTSKAQKREHNHKESDCHICSQVFLLGEAQIQRADNPNYYCIFESFLLFEIPPPHLHPHPFPVAGQPGDIAEKAIIIMWQLLQKFVLTRPKAVPICGKEFMEVFTRFTEKRIDIWRDRKISPLQSSKFRHDRTYHRVDLSGIQKKLEKFELKEDPFQLWETIKLVNFTFDDLLLSVSLNALINPLADMPAGLQGLFLEALDNYDDYLHTVSQILDALSTKVIPFRDVLKIICNGSLEKTCYFCSEKMTVDKAEGPRELLEGPVVLFNCLHTRIYLCGEKNCRKKVDKVGFKDGRFLFERVLVRTVQERFVGFCDFCFSMAPLKQVHRCSRCLTVQYCSEKCHIEDAPIHLLFCKEDVEERKKKFGSSGRRKAAKADLMRMIEAEETVKDEGETETVKDEGETETVKDEGKKETVKDEGKKETVKDEGKKKPRKKKDKDTEKDFVKAEDIEGYRGNQDLDDILHFIEGPNSVVPGKKENKLKGKKSK